MFPNDSARWLWGGEACAGEVEVTTCLDKQLSVTLYRRLHNG